MVVGVGTELVLRFGSARSGRQKGVMFYYVCTHVHAPSPPLIYGANSIPHQYLSILIHL